MLLNGKKGACFNIIVAMILNQVFDGLTSSWTLLYLVENDNGMPFFQRNNVNELELGKKRLRSEIWLTASQSSSGASAKSTTI